MTERKWIVAAFANFGVAALLGLLLRCAPFLEMPWLNFRYLTHAHSHAAMMGWLYMAIFGLILNTFLSERERNRKLFNWLFWILQFAVVGMVCSFPFQGYGAVSITFSAIHLFASYTFLIAVWKRLKNIGEQPSLLFKTAIVLMMFSTLGVYGLGPATVLTGRFSNYYHLCIQFFLHFQFQGWFLFALLALFFRRMEQKGHTVLSAKKFSWFYGLLLVACCGMMVLPMAQYMKMEFLLPFNTIGSMAQLAAVLMLLKAISNWRPQLVESSTVVNIAVWTVVISLLLKAIGQAALSWPSIAITPVLIRPMVIGFIHLLLLGAASFFIIGSLAGSSNPMAESWLVKVGSFGLLAGIIITEITLFAQAFSAWMNEIGTGFYHEMLFIGSLILVASVITLFFGVITERKQALP